MLVRGADKTQTSPGSGDETILSDAQQLLAGERAGLTAAWWVQMDTPAVYWSPEMFEIYGLHPDIEPSRELMRAAVHPEDRDDALRAGRAWEDDPRRSYSGTFRIVRPDGATRLLEMRAWMTDSDRGTERRAIGTVIDLTDAARVATEQRAASRRLRASLEHLRALSMQRGALLRQLAGAEERERLRIAADIHDDSVQTLRAVELGLERRRDLIEDPLLGRMLEEARLDVHAAATRLRGLMLELLPPVPEVPLVGTIAAYCQSQFDGTDFVYEVQGETEELAPDTYLLAYRLAQEAVRNARKHSRGRRVSVVVGTRDGRLVLEVSDDGIGLSDLDARGPRGGLRIIRQRVAAAGGESCFGPGPAGQGTRVRMELPLNEDWGT